MKLDPDIARLGARKHNHREHRTNPTSPRGCVLAHGPARVICGLMMLALTSAVCAQSRAVERADKPFAIEVVDDHTGRGIPMVELETVNGIKLITDSAGIAAFDEPGLMNQKVFFTLKSHGYEFPKDMFGFRGKALEIAPGGHAKLEMKRLNIAERLYRITGGGIYHDSVLTGRKSPIAQPLMNAQVIGQDSVQTAVYRGKVYWFWGDTQRPSYPLGNFAVSGATSDLPGKAGGLDPKLGVNLKYFVDEEGFSKKMLPLPEAQGTPVWIDAVMTLNDESGRERLVAHYIRVKDLATILSRGIVVFNDDKALFEKAVELPVDVPLAPAGHPTRTKVDGVDYLYFPSPYPNIRCRADWKSYMDVATYEGFTPLKPGTRYVKGQPDLLERGADGKLIYAWKRGTPPLTSDQAKELVDAGAMKAEESPHWLRDADSTDGAPVLLHNGSFYWNDYRKKWVMIALQGRGTSFLGEVWYAEADSIGGPWTSARKVVTHDKYSFYNPTQQPFFDQDGGRYIYFEGTFANTFSGIETLTPRYEYNQVMYRLDLADERLRAPAGGAK